MKRPTSRKLDEVTLEANPATFDVRKARLFRELGVTRVSLGIQSFAPHVLQTLGREHTAEQASESVAVLREAGIPQVNIDLMFSIPGQSETGLGNDAPPCGIPETGSHLRLQSHLRGGHRVLRSAAARRDCVRTRISTRASSIWPVIF